MPIIIWLFGAFLIARWYKTWDQGFGRGFFISTIFSPLIGAIVLLISGPKRKTCEKCAELVRVNAKVCKHCGAEFSASNKPNNADSMENIVG